VYGLAAYRGALLTGVLVIAYDTSANVSAFEGGHRHATFGGAVLYMILGAGVGCLIRYLNTHYGFARKRPEVGVRKEPEAD
jgi:hypothetical protein